MSTLVPETLRLGTRTLMLVLGPLAVGLGPLEPRSIEAELRIPTPHPRSEDNIKRANVESNAHHRVDDESRDRTNDGNERAVVAAEREKKKAGGGGGGEGGKEEEMPLMALNHVSRLCRSVKDSIEFYRKMLGFVLIERPQAFDFDGAWLFNYGISIHLVQSHAEDRLPPDSHPLDPMGNHISFQLIISNLTRCEDMSAVEHKLREMGVEYMKRTVDDDDESGASTDQLFFTNPDGFMIEICNCENLKLVPAGSLGKIKLPFDRHNPLVELNKEEES
ncbi:glyoxylase I 4 [Syzygium oleosum]|uniref:glyoxylase I 4 n=1 Tax=Syzygium oleosum TaxID=219896 RepID=UPI0024B98088|nr:glyoxylase I 4 [Syzygium oleosum]